MHELLVGLILAACVYVFVVGGTYLIFWFLTRD